MCTESSPESPHDNFFFFYIMHGVILYCRSRERERQQTDCYSKVGLPLMENSRVVEQPLNLWNLTQQYRSAALRTMREAR